MVEAMVFRRGESLLPHHVGEGVRASNEDKRASARLMRSQGHSFREIAAELEVDPKTVRLWCQNN